MATQAEPDAIVCIVGGTEAFRQELTEALKRFYIIRSFETGEELMDALRLMSPKAVIVDEMLPPMGGAPFVQRIRFSPTSKHAPIVFTCRKENGEGMAEAYSNGNVVCLPKPFRRSALVDAMSTSVNAAVEAEWETYEPVQKAALKETLSTFNSIADKIETGEPIEYDDVKDSCAPLVEAVQNASYKDILRGVQSHDNYSYVHSMRVATFVSMFGNVLGIKGDDLMTLSTGGLLHDVGKMYIPHEILNKPGKLTDDEFVVMKSHVDHSLEFLERNSDLPKGVMIIAGQHHEKLDGTGYPFGLEGKQLNRLARMATIIDIFGAITDRRVYKDPIPPERALDIMGNMTKQLDMGLLSVFKEMLLDAATVD